MELDVKSNPWKVTSLDDFLFYCCPECDDRSGTKTDFIQHARPVSTHFKNELTQLKLIASKSELTQLITRSLQNELTQLTTHLQTS